MNSAARERQKVAVIGAGAIGGFFAAAAAAAGQNVTLCVRQRFEELVVERRGGARAARVAIVDQPERVGPAPWVLLATKAQDVAAAAPWLERLAGPGTVVAVLQNGVDHVGLVGPFAPGAEILPTIVRTSAERVAPGRIRVHTGRRLVVPQSAAGERLVALFEGGDAEIVQDPDFATSAWRKLLANVSVNPITALTLRRIGVMREDAVRELARGLLAEAVEVARAEGADLSESDIEPTLDEYARFNPDGGSSMLYDRLAGRSMEHDHLTGTIVRLAERHGIPAPLNRAVLALLRASAPPPA
jgi:2-dehydropantoate 2-reductase